MKISPAGMQCMYEPSFYFLRAAERLREKKDIHTRPAWKCFKPMFRTYSRYIFSVAFSLHFSSKEFLPQQQLLSRSSSPRALSRRLGVVFFLFLFPISHKQRFDSRPRSGCSALCVLFLLLALERVSTERISLSSSRPVCRLKLKT